MPVIPELKEKISQITNLPTLPQVAARLLKIINDPQTSSNDVAFEVGQDLALSAKVLRLANSAFYGMPRTITSINNAIVILGLRVINTMVLSLTVFDMFPRDKNRSGFNRIGFWRHSLGCALIARMLSNRVRKFLLFDPEEAFCAGLLHDIGKVAMEQYLHDDLHRAIGFGMEHGVSYYEAEKQLLGYTHADVADWLTSGWSLPVELQAPLVGHHAPEAAQQCQDAIYLCHCADFLCYKAEIVMDVKYPAPRLWDECLDHLRLRDTDIEELLEQVKVEFAKMNVFMDIVAGR